MKPNAVKPGQLALITALFLVASPALGEVYSSSVVGTDFDFIVETDPNTFKTLEFKGQALAEMPSKVGDAPLRQQAFVFVSTYSDGTSIKLFMDVGFKTKALARKEALRYTPRLGKLPTSLRSGVDRLVVHKGHEDTTAFSDRGLIVIYSANATKRISTHDLEETIFHEAVHAAWDGPHAKSPAWLKAQKSDPDFVTRYAKKNPRGEDLAESALFAYTLIHHPERIPKAEAAKIRAAIPARIAFVKTLLPPGKPLIYPVPKDYKRLAAEKRRAKEEPSSKERKVDKGSNKARRGDKACKLDPKHLKTAVGISDILSNALMLGLEQDEAAVQAFLKAETGKSASAKDLFKAAAKTFGLKQAAIKGMVEKYLHCNCSHREANEAAPQSKPAEAAPVTSRPLPPAPKESLNGYVLAQMASYPMDGSYAYHWPKSGTWEGTTQTLVYQGRTLCTGDPKKRSYCCGLTFEVYLCALLKAAGGEIEGLNAAELHELRLRFFGDSKVKRERRRLAAYGLESLGLGTQLKSLDDARPGDFVQFWRHSGSGHSAIFVNWIRNRSGKITGFVYWSSQSSTRGIGYNRESIGPKAVKRDEIYIGRADWPLRPARRASRVFKRR